MTERQLEVFTQMALFKKAEDIADELFISVNTVNSHKKKIKEILDIRKPGDIIVYSLAFGYISFDPDSIE